MDMDARKLGLQLLDLCERNAGYDAVEKLAEGLSDAVKFEVINYQDLVSES